MAYLVRDLSYSIVLVAGVYWIESAPSLMVRIFGWTLYGVLQGFVGTGLWILAHECGHGAFSPYPLLNEVTGWCLHSALLVPYYAWKITHARHHRYAGHLEMDTAFVPPMKSQCTPRQGTLIDEITADTPIRSLVNLIGHQLVGWQLYLLFYATGGKGSTPEYARAGTTSLSHFNPYGALFTRQQRSKVLLSDLGILLMTVALFGAYRQVGLVQLVLLYFVPYLWVHHWIGMLVHPIRTWLSSSRILSSCYHVSSSHPPRSATLLGSLVVIHQRRTRHSRSQFWVHWPSFLPRYHRPPRHPSSLPDYTVLPCGGSNSSDTATFGGRIPEPKERQLHFITLEHV